MPRLNKDILLLIFEELQDDSKYLFSCLMVNKFWCETVIPVLWRNPWRYDIDYSNKSYLFTIFISCLPNDIKEFLTSEGIQLSPISYQSLLFDYWSFCKSIDVNIMNRIISTEASSAYNQFLLQQEFYNVLMGKCELKYLDMRSIQHQIFYFPDAKTCLDSLCELICDTSTDPLYFYGLARICQYIQKISILNTNVDDNDGIIKLIEVQRNLKYFEWIDSFNISYSIELLKDPNSKSFQALEKHANTLNHLITSFHYDYDYNYNYTFMQDLLSKFHKLRTLNFDFPPTIDYGERLKTVAYHDLEILGLLGINIHMVTCIIKNSGGYLREISIYEYYIDDNTFNDDSLNFIRIIYENCPLIEYLILPVFSSSKNHFIEFEKLLGTCKKLQSLCFQDIFYPEKDLGYAQNLLNALITASTNLRYIKFGFEIKFSLKILEEFLEKWRGRPAISISSSYFRKLDYISLINKYKNEGVIKNWVC